MDLTSIPSTGWDLLVSGARLIVEGVVYVARAIWSLY